MIILSPTIETTRAPRPPPPPPVSVGGDTPWFLQSSVTYSRVSSASLLQHVLLSTLLTIKTTLDLFGIHKRQRWVRKPKLLCLSLRAYLKVSVIKTVLMSQDISNQNKSYFITKHKYHNGKIECEGVRGQKLELWVLW